MICLPRPTRSLLAAASAACVLSGCGSAPAPSRVSPLSPSPSATSGAVGDTTSFRVRVTGLGREPDRVTYELSRPGFVTIVSVTDSAIGAIVPHVDTPSQIEMAGTHTAGLLRQAGVATTIAQQFGERAAGTIVDDNVRLAELSEYNRCVARAMSADKSRREASRPIIGRDSAGRPIYGPTPPQTASEPDPESYCRVPRAASSAAADAPGMFPARPGRYVILYLSDTPVAYKDILALAITESEPRLMASSIGRKLFTAKGAIWSGYFRPW